MAESKVGLFKQFCVKDFPKTAINNGEVVQVKSTDSIRTALKKLKEFNILSAPVYDEKSAGYVGLIDMVDIVFYMTENYDEIKRVGLKEREFMAVVGQVEKMSNPVTTIMDISSRNPFVAVNESGSMAEVIEVLSKNRLHRVPVFSEEGKLVNMITQSAIIAVLDSHSSSLGDIANKTVKELNLGTSPVITVDISQKTAEAFHIIRDNQISAVPVVNKLLDGKLVSNISVKDIRAIGTDPANLYRLYDPVSSFLAATHDDEIDAHFPLLWCTESDCLATVIRRLGSSRMHRVYVIDRDIKPLRCISLTDVLCVLV